MLVPLFNPSTEGCCIDIDVVRVVIDLVHLGIDVVHLGIDVVFLAVHVVWMAVQTIRMADHIGYSDHVGRRLGESRSTCTGTFKRTSEDD